MTPLIVALTVAVAAPVPKDEKAEAAFREKVTTTRAKAVKYLKEKQGKDGGWEGALLGDIAGLKGGTTALATLALLEAGVPPNDPAVTNAVAYLVQLKPERTYVVSLQTQVLARVSAKKHAKEIQANVDWLLDKAIMKEKKLQGWSYPANTIADNSNTHFAVMGLHAAAQAGAKVDPEIWRKIRNYYAETQKQNGGWPYHNAGGGQTTHSMTVAALLGLTVAAKYDKQVKGPHPEFEKGMAALLGGKLGEFGDGKSSFVAWMTVAELGRAMGATEFKSGKLAKPWYRDGAEKLLKSQQEDSSFQFGQKNSIDGGQPVITTACALYFLGTGPAKK